MTLQHSGNISKEQNKEYVVPNSNVLFVSKTWNAYRLIRILRQCFTKDYVSIGALIRKLPNFLFMLCRVTECTWTASFFYDNNGSRFICTVSDFDGNSFNFRIPVSGAIYRHGCKLIDQFFTKDRFLQEKHTALLVQFLFENKFLLYDKQRFSGTSFTLVISPDDSLIRSCIMRWKKQTVRVISHS